MSSNDKSVILAEFTHFKHIKTRKVVVLECEISEELFQQAIATLGMPIGGESKPVAIALLAEQSAQKPNPEGIKLRTRAVLLCDDFQFQQYCAQSPDFERIVNPNPIHAKLFIYHACKIKSRAELATNLDAQSLFVELLSKYETWKSSKIYEDNLNR